MDLALLFSAAAFVVSVVALVVALRIRQRVAVRVVYLRDASAVEIKTPTWRYVRYIYETPSGVFTMEAMEEFARRRV